MAFFNNGLANTHKNNIPKFFVQCKRELNEIFPIETHSDAAMQHKLTVKQFNSHPISIKLHKNF